jgi:hypothetical protein
MSAPIFNPPARVANDVATATIAGYALAWAGMTGGAAGGLLNLRVGLRTSTLVDLARALARLPGVRVTSGPPISTRGDCYLVHCPGFKMVLSAPALGDDAAQALVSRTAPPALAVPCPLSDALAELMTVRPGRPPAEAQEPQAPAAQTSSPRTSTLRRAPLQPGKTLAHKKPLLRKTPLGPGRKLKP